MARALLLLNPKSQQGETDISGGLKVLEEHGIEIIKEAPHNSDELRNLIRHHRDAVDRVIVGGGDGTLHMALQGLIETDVPMGILPLGTANDLSRTLDLPDDIVAACEVIAAGHRRLIDIGKVNDVYFFNAANIGLGVEVARRLDGEVKKKLGVLAYLYGAYDAARVSRAFSVDIEYDGKKEHLHAVQVAVGNGRYYGGGMCISEDAEIDDGKLDLYAVPSQSWHRLLRLVPALRTGKTPRFKNVVNVQSAKLHIQTRKSKSVTVDGEHATKTPATFRLLPRALAVYTPQNTA